MGHRRTGLPDIALGVRRTTNGGIYSYVIEEPSDESQCHLARKREGHSLAGRATRSHRPARSSGVFLCAANVLFSLVSNAKKSRLLANE